MINKNKWEVIKSEFEDFKFKFKRFDPKLQKNILIGSFMVFSVLATGIFLLITAVVRFGGKILDSKLALY